MPTEDIHKSFTLVHGSSPKAEFSEALMSPGRSHRLAGIRALAMLQGLFAETQPSDPAFPFNNLVNKLLLAPSKLIK